MSIWNKNEVKRNIKKLDSDKTVDILIIGAGITGITAAYLLKDKSICVVDANKIGHGVTINTTAKINYLQERIYTKIKNSTNEYNAKMYLKSQILAIDTIKEIIKKENIKCDFKQVSSYIFTDKAKEIDLIKKEYEFLKGHGINIIENNMPNNIFSYKSYSVDDTYIFNPIKYINSIYDILKKDDVNIYENSKTVKIKKENNYYICYGEKYNIKAKKVIFACHYPFFLAPFFLPIKSYIEKSYVLVSKVKKDGNFTCINTCTPTYSCRFYEDGNDIYQISVGESHNTAFKQNDEEHFEKLKNKFNLKNEDIVMSYTNCDIITSDYMPYIGRIKNNMYIACGYNTWGMTNGILAATIISDLVLGKENEFEKVFNPKRFNLLTAIKLPIVLFNQSKAFIESKIIKNKPWYKDNISFELKNGKSVATYKDEKGFKHTIYNKCPHLGCSLIFNYSEKTWDCPCHSSRFDIEGKCIKGPSKYDIGYKE